MIDPIDSVALRTTVNGQPREHHVAPSILLVEYLRDIVGLTGTHIACDTSQCGACTVLVDRRPVKSCTMLAIQAAGRVVTTIEGLAEDDGTLHPVQRAFWENFALQCGYCTPGFIMSCVALLEAGEVSDDAAVRRALAGNLCRCTGYVGILSAVRAARAAVSAIPGSSASE
jgi:carbon-monoxide dehydrogenase small subunit